MLDDYNYEGDIEWDVELEEVVDEDEVERWIRELDEAFLASLSEECDLQF